MGKRLIIKGADFTENGMKALNYVSNVYSTVRSNHAVILVGENCAITTIPNNNINIMIKFKFSNNDTLGNLFECFGSNPHPNLFFAKSYNSEIHAEQECNMYIYRYSNNGPSLTLNLKKDEIYTIDMKASEKKIILNGVEYENVNTGIPGELSKMHILSDADVFRIMEFKYYTNNGNVLMHLIPIKDYDGVPCLHDTITETNFYPSEGTLGYEV